VEAVKGLLECPSATKSIRCLTGVRISEEPKPHSGPEASNISLEILASREGIEALSTRPMACFVNVKTIGGIIFSIFNRFNLDWSNRRALRVFTQAA
jgi:hypothetical protein